MNTRNLDSSSNHESTGKLEHLAARLRGRILALAREAGRAGLTINGAERRIDDHKGHSISPRFAELVEHGSLVRVLIGHGKPTKRFPGGVPRYITRFDEQTKRSVIVHWLPELAPATGGAVPQMVLELGDAA